MCPLMLLGHSAQQLGLGVVDSQWLPGGQSRPLGWAGDLHLP